MNTIAASNRQLRASGRALVVLATTVLLSLALAVGPAMATEGEHVKTPLPESQHDLVGLVILALTGLATLAAIANARRQLKGERDQASGDFRWR